MVQGAAPRLGPLSWLSVPSALLGVPRRGREEPKRLRVGRRVGQGSELTLQLIFKPLELLLALPQLHRGQVFTCPRTAHLWAWNPRAALSPAPRGLAPLVFAFYENFVPSAVTTRKWPCGFLLLVSLAVWEAEAGRSQVPVQPGPHLLIKQQRIQPWVGPGSHSRYGGGVLSTRAGTGVCGVCGAGGEAEPPEPQLHLPRWSKQAGQLRLLRRTGCGGVGGWGSGAPAPRPAALPGKPSLPLAELRSPDPSRSAQA